MPLKEKFNVTYIYPRNERYDSAEPQEEHRILARKQKQE